MIAATPGDPVARVDALVAAIGPPLDAPPIGRRDVVLVTGPWLAGVSSVAAALRERVPQHRFVEAPEPGPAHAPVAVVFVVSATTPLTESDCALLDAAAEHTDVVIGAVSKIDVHRTWPDVLIANRALLAGHAPRYQKVPWVGVAAAPELGPPLLDELAATVQHQLADGRIAQRNRLRAWKSQLQTVAQRFDRDVEGAGRQAQVAELREKRSAVLRQRRRWRTAHALALRCQLQRARVQLCYLARHRCASLRGELQEEIAGLARRRILHFESDSRGRVHEVLAEVSEVIETHLAEVAQALRLPVQRPAVDQLPTVTILAPPLTSRGLETRLMLVLGAGFGLGVALGLGRLLAGLAPSSNPWLTVAGIVGCVVLGLAVTLWVVNTRAVLGDRATLDRWTGDVTSSLRAVLEQLVATRVLAAESQLSTALGAREEAENTRVADRVSLIDSELREHATAAARVAALRDELMPTIRAALDAVGAELGEPGIPSTNTRSVSSRAAAGSNLGMSWSF
ncbi:hypothetical protein [Mycobacterium simiae]|uniref:hypothetical protein n=1 Tax=Mycobacterium simiae TaxID=1784 RepID=UPI0021CDDC1E|nr:hypothetical protein [Mycobacterium simiae]